MNTVTVSASKQYEIRIGSGLLSGLGQAIRSLAAPKAVCLVSESTVFPLYGSAAVSSLESAGFSVISFVFPAGEESKNGETYLELLNFLAQNQLTRSDWIVALGGGVVGDLAGFSAGSYKDLTRVAWLNPQMWAELFLENKENVLFELDCYIHSLQEYRQAIASGNSEALISLLEEGKKRKEEVDG